MDFKFGDKETIASINRKYVPILEHSLQRPLFATLRAFAAGFWSFDEVAKIISFAIHGPGEMNVQLHGMEKIMGHTSIGKYQPEADVLEILIRDGHGQYAPIAAELIAEALGDVSGVVVDDAA